MKRSNMQTDGGETFSDQSIEYEPTTSLDRWRTFIELWLLAPMRIMWHDRRTRYGGMIILFYLLMGTVGLYVVEPPAHNQGPILDSAFSSWDHPLGTDNMGQDLLSLTVHATPAMLQMMFAGGIFATVLGTVVGTLAGYKRGTTERVLLTISDIVMTIPGLPLLIVLAVALEPRNPILVGVLLAINAWAGLARSIHSQVLALRSESYVEASRVIGLGSPTIIRDDILPNLMPFIMINFMGTTVGIISTSVALYFLAVLPFTHLNWGVVLNLAYQGGALSSWGVAHWIIVPIVAISLIGFGITIFAQGMDRLFNPRVRSRHASHGSDSGEAMAQIN